MITSRRRSCFSIDTTLGFGMPTDRWSGSGLYEPHDHRARRSCAAATSGGSLAWPTAHDLQSCFIRITSIETINRATKDRITIK
jgi:hypothetical protein